MAYEAPPNFLSGNRGAFWWAVSVGGRIRMCQSQGASIIARARRKLSDRGVTAGSGGAMDAALINGMAARLRLLEDSNPGQGWADLAGTLEGDATRRDVTSRVMRALIWIAYLDGTSNPMERIAFSSNSVFPSMDESPQPDGSPVSDYAAECWWQDEPDSQPAPGHVALAQATSSDAPNDARNPAAGPAGNARRSDRTPDQARAAGLAPVPIKNPEGAVETPSSLGLWIVGVLILASVGVLVWSSGWWDKIRGKRGQHNRAKAEAKAKGKKK